LYWGILRYIRVDARNGHFKTSGDYLLDRRGQSLVGYFGAATELCIDKEIDELCEDCFMLNKVVSVVSFEPGSRLRRIGECAFWSSRLTSIVIPSSVEILASRCFWYCYLLLTLRFELNSRLSVIEEGALEFAHSLKTVWIPACLETLIVGHLRRTDGVQIVILETGAIRSPW
jgi:hypothetical protein